MIATASPIRPRERVPVTRTKKCLYCERRFSKAEHLKRHQRSHTGEQPYKCSFCPKSFSRSDVLGRHARGHAQQEGSEGENEDNSFSYQNGDRGRRRVSNSVQNVDQNMSMGPAENAGESWSEEEIGTILVDMSANLSPFPQPEAPFPMSQNGELQQPLMNSHINQVEARQADSQPQGAAQQDTHMENAHITNNSELISRTQPPNSGSIIRVDRNNHYESMKHSSGFFSHENPFLPVEQFPFSNDTDLRHLDGMVSSNPTPSMGALIADEGAGMPESFAMWFEQYDNDSHVNQDFLGSSSNLIPRFQAETSPAGAQSRHGSMESPRSASDYIPAERFAKVEQCWPTRPVNKTRLMLDLWHDLIHLPDSNIFSEPYVTDAGPETHITDQQQGSRWGIDDQCRDRLQQIYGRTYRVRRHLERSRPRIIGIDQDTVETANQTRQNTPTAHKTSIHELAFPSAEVLDIGLDLYFRHFHPLMPFVHIPTFCAKSTRTSLLFTMCLIGLTILRTDVSTAFVRQAFPVVLEKSFEEVNMCSAGTKTASDMMSAFITAFVTTTLSQMTGDQNYQQQCQMLYITVLTIAQRHGLFTANDSEALTEVSLNRLSDASLRWKAWSRIESAKRIVICLVMHDAWFAALLHTSPIIRTDDIQIVLPCDSALFGAKSANEWTRLTTKAQKKHAVCMPSLVLAPYHVPLPGLYRTSDAHGMHGILCALRLRISNSYHRLLSSHRHSDLSSQTYVPWHTYQKDSQASLAAPSIIEVYFTYGAMLREMNSNCMVLWHNLAIMLCADLPIFEAGAGREGANSARKALDQIAVWTQTSAARRACLHAAQTFRVISNRRLSDGIMFHSPGCLFYSGLVLGLYVFLAPPRATEDIVDEEGSEVLELLDDVDWESIGALGLQPDAQHISGAEDDAATRFIRRGGNVSFAGILQETGYQSARRIMLDFAGLLEDVGKWRVGKFSRVLRIMSDTLVDVDGTAQESQD